MNVYSRACLILRIPSVAYGEEPLAGMAFGVRGCSHGFASRPLECYLVDCELKCSILRGFRKKSLR